VQQSEKELSKKKNRLNRILTKLGNGTVIVEGKHDLRFLKEELGLSDVVTFAQLCYSRTDLDHSTRLYPMMDKDSGGEQKKEQIRAILSEQCPGVSPDYNAVEQFFRVVGVKRVEEACRSVRRILEAQESDYYG
jgi:5S rRNA maturation endonuclease (ribonuclease M5)